MFANATERGAGISITIPSFPMQLWRHAGCFFVFDILLLAPSIKSKMLFLANHNAKIKKKKKNYNKLRKIPEYFFSKACRGRFSKILFVKIKSRDCQRFSFTFSTYMVSKTIFREKKLQKINHKNMFLRLYKHSMDQERNVSKLQPFHFPKNVLDTLYNYCKHTTRDFDF